MWKFLLETESFQMSTFNYIAFDGFLVINSNSYLKFVSKTSTVKVTIKNC